MTHAVPLETDIAVTKARWLDWFGVLALVAVIGAQAHGVLTSPPDRDMGDLQKIMYVHVPSAWNAFMAFFDVSQLLVGTKRECVHGVFRRGGRQPAVPLEGSGKT